jgi:outer membrane receptor protein involved in Fe transport
MSFDYGRFKRPSVLYLSGLLVTLSAAPLASRAADTAGAEEKLEEVVVTGTHLTTAGFDAPTPVTVMSTQTIETRAPANVADVINEQPEFRVNQSDTTRNGNPQPGATQETLNLRNLGANRTLVLINGHRVAPTLWDSTVDTSIIPTGLVERIDVVTGGASAAYGSDAVAGVVNIILRNKLEGIRASVQVGQTEYQSAKQYTATLAGGTALFNDRLNVIGGIDYTDSKLVGNAYGTLWGQREVAANLAPTNAQRSVASNPLPQTYIANNVEPGNAAPGGLWQQTPTVGQTPGVAYTFDANGNPVPFVQGTTWGANSQFMTGSTANYGYNPNSLNVLRVPIERTAGYGRAQFAVTDKINATLELNKARDVTEPYKFNEFISQGPATNTAGSPYLVIGSANPFLTPATKALLFPNAGVTQVNMGRIDTDFGLAGPWGIAGQAYEQTTDVDRWLVGMDGTFGAGDSWHWDTYIQRGTTDLLTQRYDLSPTALQFAVDGCTGTVGLNAAAQAAVATYTQVTGKTCVPYNPFGVNRNPVSAQNWFMNPTWTRQELSQISEAATMSGSLWNLPAGPLAVAFGAEHRKDTARGTVDPVSIVGTLMQFNYQPLARDNTSTVSNSVSEGFAELGVPVLKGVPFAQTLDLNTALRRTDYSQSGFVTTWKVGLTWKPVDVLTVRYTRSRDIRAPNLNEIFFQGGAGPSATVINRTPIGTVGAGGTVNTNPAGTGATQNLSINTVGASGGGSTLKPEIADTNTGGLVFQAGGLSASVDYYKIKINGVIAAPGNQQIIDNCAAGDTVSCHMITFNNNPATGYIALIAPTQSNLNYMEVSGYDFEVGYRESVLGGHFNVRGLVNYQPHSFTINASTQQKTESANALNGQPKLAYNLSFGFDKDRWATNVQIRGFTQRLGNPVVYNPDGSINATTIFGPEDAGYAARFNPAVADNTITRNRWPGQFTVNPSVSFKVTDNVSLFANIDNLFNVGPPALSTSNAYDLIGRRFRLGARAEF